MASRKSQWTVIGKRKLELSNLDKVLFPEDNVLKAEVIEYYLNLAPTILRHIKGRPLTLIRFPDGIHGESFYQKNRPDWAPDWVEFVQLGKEKKDYILASEAASLVWLANLASIELHQMHSRRPQYENPDYMVFDLDPPEGRDFQNVKDIAFSLKDYLEGFGYVPFVKTTGGKGLHILCPLEPKWNFSQVFEAAQAIAKPFVESHDTTTLHIKKEARKGRVLIDIYRIRQGQSIVSPYSLRGRVGAPVSTPLTWETLEKVKSPLELNIHNALKRIEEEGDPWETIDAYASELHTDRKKSAGKARTLEPSRKRKTAEQLERYSKKRNFSKTPEPAGYVEPGRGNGFVVHRHHASHLHYDLRLEQDGVLKSWAVPKGLPQRPGIKRLAMQTEDHPLEYLNFEGKIPKGQYGGGDMWIYAIGRYLVTKDKKDGFYFKLMSPAVNGEYRIYKIKEKEWLLERVDPVQSDLLKSPPEFMLSDSSTRVPSSSDYLFEVKWDGIRTMVSLDEGELRLFSRNGRDITAQFPELHIPSEVFRVTNGLFDGEIVCLSKSGTPDFKKVISRLMSTGDTSIKKLSSTSPAYCYLFDCLFCDGRSTMNESLLRRREWLRDSVRPGTPYRVSEFVEDGKGLFAAAAEHGLEGIMAKRKDSKYLPGKRGDAWLKIKVRNSADCLIVGYTAGKGDRKDSFGALQVAELKEGSLQYRGKVGTGFDGALIRELHGQLSKMKKVKKPLAAKVQDEKLTTWVEPHLMAEVSYSSITKDKMFREPVFVRLRPDLDGA